MINKTNKADTRKKARVSLAAEKAIGYRLVMGCLRKSHYWREKARVSGKMRSFGMANKADGTNKTDTRRKAKVSHFAEKASGIGLLWDACRCRTIGERKRGFRLDMGDFRDADTTNCH